MRSRLTVKLALPLWAVAVGIVAAQPGTGPAPLAGAGGLRLTAAANGNGNGSTAGAFAVTNSRCSAAGCQAVVTATGLLPGGSVSADMTLADTGAIAGTLSLATANVADPRLGAGGGRLSQRLVIGLAEPAAARTFYSGALSGLTRSVALGKLAARTSRTFRLTVALPDGGRPVSRLSGDNAYQGASATFDVTWAATSCPAATAC